MIVLGIETSCDETAAALVNDKREVLSNIVLGQLEEHSVYGGVVPEIAARSHLEHIGHVVDIALREADLGFQDIQGVAATCGPGLIGGVIVGMMTAKAIAAARNIPFLAVNHLEGHALTPRLTENTPFPYLLLLVSGGHTQILVAENVGVYKRWGTTLDDAVGECFDKCAKLMSLPFPGGPNLEIMAKNCRNPVTAREKYPLPSPMKGRKNCDFSFSGLKTAVRLHVQNMPPEKNTPEEIADLAYSFQQTAADVLADRCKHALEKFLAAYAPLPHTPTLVVAGGVSANMTVRARLEELCKKMNVNLYAPPLSLCGDNAAMIAWAGIERLKLGQNDPLDFKAHPRWPLDPTATPSHGAGVKA